MKKKAKETPSEILVKTFVREGMQYSNDEYLSEMLNVGVTERQLANAAFEFAMDNMPHEFDTRLTNAERLEVGKRLKKYFKEVVR